MLRFAVGMFADKYGARTCLSDRRDCLRVGGRLIIQVDSNSFYGIDFLPLCKTMVRFFDLVGGMPLDMGRLDCAFPMLQDGREFSQSISPKDNPGRSIRSTY